MSLSELWSLYGQNYIDALLATWGMTLESFAIAMVLAVAYVVSYPDLMQNARVLITNYDALVSVYLVIAVIYILINVAINKAAVYVSHKTGAAIIR